MERKRINKRKKLQSLKIELDGSGSYSPLTTTLRSRDARNEKKLIK